MKFFYIKKMKLLSLLLLLQLIVLAFSVPVEPQSGSEATEVSANTPLLEETTTPSETLQVNQNKIRGENEAALTGAHMLNDTKTEQQASANEFVGTVGAMALPDQEASSSSYEPSVYANLITPEAFQQYVNQFGAAYAPYAAAAAAAGAYQTPAMAAYPSPGVIYPAPAAATATATYPYPTPYVVQTGYEGYLVPTTATTNVPAITTPTDIATVSSRPGSLIGKLLSSLMMSTVFRVAITIISTIAMVLFGNLFAGAICRLTPLCDLSTKTITYLRSGGGAQDVGRMIAEEMTPERVRRATDFVRNAIRKYRALQQLVASSDGAGAKEQATHN